MKLEVLRLLLIALIMLCQYAFDGVIAADNVGKRFAYSIDHELPIAYATVNNAELPLLIDSCSSRSFVFDFHAESVTLSQSSGVLTSSGRQSFSLTSHPETLLLLPGLPQRRMTFYRFSGQDQSFITREMAGVVGLDYLQNFAIHMKESAGIVRVITSNQGDHESADWQPLRFVKRYGHPVISIPLSSSTREYFRIDTGFAGTVFLSQTTAEKLSMSEMMYSGGETESIVAGGISQSRNCWVKSFELGGRSFRNVPGYVGDNNLIGLKLLSQFEVLIDFPNGRISLVPDPDAKPLDFRPGGSGLTFHHVPASDGLFSVSKIKEGSAGEAAGIEVQDKLISIDGTSVKEFQSPIPVYRLLQGEGRTVQLEFSRDGEQRRVELKLRYTVPYPPEWPPAPARAPLLPDLK
jgi:hypothetical protein